VTALKLQVKDLKQRQRLAARDENAKIAAAVKPLFTPEQIKKLLTKKNIRWSAEDISAAISLRSVSQKGYRYLKNHRKYPLPSVSTLRRWAARFNVQPGLLKNVLPLMQQKSKNMSLRERLTVISFDEMFIKIKCAWRKKRRQYLAPTALFRS
jgi:hypothetical protein